jgi:hypothetical protein
VLYRLTDDLVGLEPVPFADFIRYAKREKHLEEVLSRHLFDTLFEGTPLLPFHQERSYQPEGDIYALDRSGGVVVFELKVAAAGDAALAQLLRYAQVAGGWAYPEIDRKFRAYQQRLPYGSAGVELAEAHRQAFGLPAALRPEEFNRTQRMVVVGSAADAELVRAVDYWRGKGLDIDFCPYRIFELGGRPYFEFFAKPYDAHSNPAEAKGVLFDTCRNHLPDALRHMLDRRRVSAFGGRKDAVDGLSRNDLVFYSHARVGVVAAARVTGREVRADTFQGVEERYLDVEFVTPVPPPADAVPAAVPFPRVGEVTGKSFFWARIVKVPYLTPDESARLLDELRKVLGGGGADSPPA